VGKESGVLLVSRILDNTLPQPPQPAHITNDESEPLLLSYFIIIIDIIIRALHYWRLRYHHSMSVVVVVVVVVMVVMVVVVVVYSRIENLPELVHGLIIGSTVGVGLLPRVIHKRGGVGAAYIEENKWN